MITPEDAVIALANHVGLQMSKVGLKNLSAFFFIQVGKIDFIFLILRTLLL